jgi:predicted nucleic acid-binding protein
MATLEIAEKIGEVINATKILHPNLEVIQKTGELIRQSTKGLDFTDARIAATAIIGNLKLLSLNHKDFSGIKGLDLIEDIELEMGA